mmetsp:Transcript_25912/g.40429  ORF Transcript_25912/g.40429 Transcript_25912/m.40429 type:complete len:321 (-) Transcript_25912:7-969(-)
MSADARALLDSLMGQTRNISLDEAKKTKGKNFMKDTVCKAYLLGFCPRSELAESKMAGKRHIKGCEKTHSDAMKDEFSAHPDKAKLQAEYEAQLLPVLEVLAREADQWVAREKANVSKNAGGGPVEVTKNTMTEEEKDQYNQLKEDMNKMMAAAEVEAEKGNVDGSKFKVMLADEIKEKVQELEEKHIQTFEVTARGEDVCEICGTRYEALTATNHARHAAHFTGKVHLGYVKIRDWIAELRKKRDGDKRPANDDDGKRERRRSKSRRDKRAGSRERDRRDDRRRSRSRNEKRGRSRDAERERHRHRSRSRGDRRGRGRD